MTDDKISNISRAIAMVIIILICFLVFVARTFGQENQPPSGQNSAHDHVSNRLSRFRLVRVIPAKVTYVERNENGTRIEYIAKDHYEIENGYFQATKETKGDEPKKGDWYWFSFCQDDRHLYGIYRPTQEQLRVLK